MCLYDVITYMSKPVNKTTDYHLFSMVFHLGELLGTAPAK